MRRACALPLLGALVACGAPQHYASVEGPGGSVTLGPDAPRAAGLTRGMTDALAIAGGPAERLASLAAYIEAHREEMGRLAERVRARLDASSAAERAAYESALDVAMSDAVFAWHDALEAFREDHEAHAEELNAILAPLGVQYR